MILHIFKKDMRLLWPFAAGSAALWFGLVASNILAETSYGWTQASQLLVLGSRIAAILLAILAVQQDPVPGTRGDWLTRPIKRSDMLLAKLLFCTVTIGLPVFTAFLTQSLANGHTMVDAIGAAGATAVTILVATAPFVAIAALTDSLILALVCAFVVALGTGLSFIIDAVVTHMALNTSGLGWMVTIFDTALVVLGTLIILPMQYVRRKTRSARALMTAGVMVGCAAFVFPWHAAFAIERALSPAPAGANPVQIVFDPSQPRHHRSDSYGLPAYIPVRISPPEGDGVLVVDHIDYSLRDAEGRVVAHADQTGWTHPAGGAAAADVHVLGAPQSLYQGLSLPPGDYSRLKNQPLRLQVDYALTLFRPGRTAQLAINAAPVALPGFGACSAAPGETAADTGQVSCLGTATTPTCVTAHLSATAPGDDSTCRADYEPVFLRANLALGTTKAIAGFQLDHAPLPGDRVMLTRYAVAGHFNRRLIVPNIKLSDWAPVFRRSDTERPQN